MTYAAQHGDAWRVGFDCAHLGDHVPGLSMPPWGALDVYRDEAYVRREIDSLVRQAQQAAKGAA